nr:unnamed protein product [Digitaria exilis]
MKLELPPGASSPRCCKRELAPPPWGSSPCSHSMSALRLPWGARHAAAQRVLHAAPRLASWGQAEAAAATRARAIEGPTRCRWRRELAGSRATRRWSSPPGTRGSKSSPGERRRQRREHECEES